MPFTRASRSGMFFSSTTANPSSLLPPPSSTPPPSSSSFATALRCTAALRRHRCSSPSTVESTAAGHRLPPATVAVPSDDQWIWTTSLSDGQPRRSQVHNPLNAPPRAACVSVTRRHVAGNRHCSDSCPVDLDLLFKRDPTLVVPSSEASAPVVTRRFFSVRSQARVCHAPPSQRQNRTATLQVVSPEHSLSFQTLESSHCCKLQWVSSSASSDLSRRILPLLSPFRSIPSSFSVWFLEQPPLCTSFFSILESSSLSHLAEALKSTSQFGLPCSSQKWLQLARRLRLCR
ncbi:hypothetical protein VIGAN_04092200 [Vigna angularis var. angularis]|uniref:Uncharacterized protein n=1 Tax=Vigna angularis var. angularis TaxID=157739 RepID=A0A0S3RSY8_PHAAN|nr:hypothetical protein VIGAN_04092200 [Vigna angularis var. angularis]